MGFGFGFDGRMNIIFIGRTSTILTLHVKSYKIVAVQCGSTLDQMLHWSNRKQDIALLCVSTKDLKIQSNVVPPICRISFNLIFIFTDFAHTKRQDFNVTNKDEKL